MSYLLDANVVSELRRVKPHGAVLAWVRARDSKDLHVSAVTVAEIQTGIEMTRRQNARKAEEISAWLDRIVLAFDIVPMDGGCFRRWAVMMHGRSAGAFEDAMIAATADINDLTVVTRSTKHFQPFGVRTLDPFIKH